MFLGKYFPPSMVMKLRNEITNFHTFYNGLNLRHRDTINAAAGGTFMKSSITSSSDPEIVALKTEMAKINKNLMRVLQPPLAKLRPYVLREPSKVVTLTNHKMNTASSSGSETLPGNTVNNPKEDLKDITTCSETAYQGPTIHTSSSSLPKVVEQKLWDPNKFFIPCDFPGMDECLALADHGASINLKPLSVWNKLSLHELSPKCMTLELVDRSISHPVGVAEDVFVKVGTFHFPADFVVVDFDANPRVPLILGRSFLKTERALINVFEGELTLHVGKEAITFNLDQTSRYSANYNDMTANRIDVIDMACEQYSQEVLGFSDVIASGNPTPYYDPIISTSSSTLTPFGDSDFLLKEVDAFLTLEDDPTSPEVDQSYFDPEGIFFFWKHFSMMIHHYPLPIKKIICLKFERNLKFVKLKPINLQLMM
nr:reverse transcriptase domain-containing protein [Tanacetum cinerariifolium]